MAFDRPDLQTLISRTVTDINSRFDGTYNALRRKATSVFARVLAGMAHGLYGYVDWAARQILPDTQDDDQLLRYGAMMGVTRKAEGKAAGNLTVTGTNDAVIDAGTLWQRADGVEYVATAGATIASGSATVPVQAVLAGSGGNADAADALALVSPIAGVNAAAVVAAGGLTGGQDAEAIDLYRQRVLERTATYYSGANAAIYIKWAKEITGVTRAWCYENTPADGSVTVLFVCDEQVGGIVPDAPKIAAVEDYLEEHTDPVTGQIVGRAVNVTLVVDAPATQAVNFTILPNPNTATVREAIEAELTDMIRRDSSPGGDILLSHIREAISVAAGETDYVLTAPAANISVADGTIAIMGTITWS
jgi:uncharacterized phage protein gp47/JayE